MTRIAPLLALDKVSAWYGQAQILHDLSLSVDGGEIVALLGRNGAGKSTCLKAIMGLLSALRGQITFAGESLTRLPAHRTARLGLGYVPEERRIFKELTVLENLEIGRQPPRPGCPHWTIEHLFSLFPNLAEMRQRRGDQMSGGEQQMLAIARTLMGNPRLVLLDEPSEGLAPVIVDRMIDAIRALKAEGLTVLLSEQNLAFAGKVCDRACIIEKGRIRFAGSIKTLLADQKLREAYLSV